MCKISRIQTCGFSLAHNQINPLFEQVTPKSAKDKSLKKPPSPLPPAELQDKWRRLALITRSK